MSKTELLEDIMENDGIKKNLGVILFKLLNEVFFVFSIFFILALMAEAVLPGLISSKINFTKMSLLIFLNFIALIYLGKKYDFEFKKIETKKGRIVLVSAILLLLIPVYFSLWGFGFWEIAVILPLTLFLFFYLYKIIFSEER